MLLRLTHALSLTLCLAAACSKGQDTAADTSTVGAIDSAGAVGGSARLTAAQVDGTWQGVTTPDTGSAAPTRWTVRYAGPTAILVTQPAGDSSRYQVAYDADSIFGVSDPTPAAPGGPPMVWRAVGRMQGEKLVGTVTASPVGKPDSVIVRGRWEAQRAR
jgi:hypothetical protein